MKMFWFLLLLFHSLHQHLNYQKIHMHHNLDTTRQVTCWTRVIHVCVPTWGRELNVSCRPSFMSTARFAGPAGLAMHGPFHCFLCSLFDRCRYGYWNLWQVLATKGFPFCGQSPFTSIPPYLFQLEYYMSVRYIAYWHIVFKLEKIYVKNCACKQSNMCIPPPPTHPWGQKQL